MVTITEIEEQSQLILDDIFGDDLTAESICLRDLVEWAGENCSTIDSQELAQLVVYSEDKLRELYEIYLELQ